MNTHIIFHHDDPDGHYAGAIMRNYILKDMNECDSGDRNVIAIPKNYSDTFTQDIGDKYHVSVYFVDLSFSESSLWKLEHVAKMENVDEFVWIDHHQTSSDVVMKVAEMFKDKKFAILFNQDLCGAALTYAYVQECIDRDYHMVRLNTVILCEVSRGVTAGYNYVYANLSTPKDNLDSPPIYIPKALYHLDAYDRWTKQDPDADYFITGLKIENYTLTDYNPIYKPDTQRFLTDEFADLCIKNGTIALTYQMMVHNEHSSRISKWSFGGKKIVYKNSLGNSWNFLDYLNNDPNSEDGAHYAILGAFLPIIGQWQYSIYKNINIKDDDNSVRCDLMAAQLGGGGHKGAAGFTKPDCLFGKSSDEMVVYIADNTKDPSVFGITELEIQKCRERISTKECGDDSEKKEELLKRICFGGSMYFMSEGSYNRILPRVYDIISKLPENLCYAPTTFDQYGSYHSDDQMTFFEERMKSKFHMYIFIPGCEDFIEWYFLNSDLRNMEKNGHHVMAIFVNNVDGDTWDNGIVEFINNLKDKYPSNIKLVDSPESMFFYLGKYFTDVYLSN